MAISSIFAAGQRTTTGDDLVNVIATSRNAAGNILVNGGTVPIQGGTPTVANSSLIQVVGKDGDDTIALDETSGALPAANLFGGAGDDTLTGGSAADTLLGEGDDQVFGAAGLAVNAPRAAVPKLRAKARRVADDAPAQTTSAAQPASGRFDVLMQAAQDGDKLAYERLLRDIIPVVRSAARRRQPFLSAADIDDVVQETLVSVHLARATYDPRRPFLPWLFAILASRLIDSARRYASRSAREVYDENAEPIPVPSEDDIAGERYRDPQLLMRAIRELPHTQRHVVELLKLREMSLKEAAAATGMSIAAVKVAMHRAMISLRRKLGVFTVVGDSATPERAP